MNRASHSLPYSINRWGQNYFSVNSQGQLQFSIPAADSPAVTLTDIAEQINGAGLRLPALVRFTAILHDRVNSLVSAFNRSIETQHYQGDYQIVYPIKVNQQRRVIEEIAATEPARQQQQVGLEAGSKPELLAILALAQKPGTTIVCNGYKDRAYIHLALLGQKLGYLVHIVIEKPSELPLIVALANELKVTPSIGLRARLNSIGKGNWQNTGGEKSKFGLSAEQILETLSYLKEHDCLDTLRLLHFHLGSQIANIRDIQTGLNECARIYAQLRKLGAPIDFIDIGGGLGVDYDGTESRNICSINYSFADYAQTVVRVFKECCDDSALPHPNLISESGRAITAHHAVLIADVVEKEVPHAQPQQANLNGASNALRHLWSDYTALQQTNMSRSLIELYHDAMHAIDDIHQQFEQGSTSLEEQAQAEQIYKAICQQLLTRLDPTHRDHQEIIDQLNEKLAEKLFVNFSVFQSIPDVWGINQVFPITPIEHLDQPLTRRAVVQDITCDSDGRIDQYVSSHGLESTLRLPESGKDKELLCFFLVGAYQEILGDMHNLFGDTDSVDVEVDARGQIHLDHAIRGDTVADVLNYVNLAPDYLLDKYRTLLKARGIDGDNYDHLLLAFEEGLGSYTYLT